jgi:hypothetical protein
MDPKAVNDSASPPRPLAAAAVVQRQQPESACGIFAIPPPDSVFDVALIARASPLLALQHPLGMRTLADRLSKLTEPLPDALR